MSCEKMESRILGYVDGRLKDSERLEVEKHLASCAPCTLRLNEFRAVSDLLGELPMIEPSDAFDTRVHALVAAEPAPKQSWWAWLDFSPRIAFAASMLLIAALYLGISRNATVAPVMNPEQADAQMIQDLPVLEDHDVLQNFEPLKDLPAQPYEDDSDQTQQKM
jgi:anti-sigma factor RsiW